MAGSREFNMNALTIVGLVEWSSIIGETTVNGS